MGQRLHDNEKSVLDRHGRRGRIGSAGRLPERVPDENPAHRATGGTADVVPEIFAEFVGRPTRLDDWAVAFCCAIYGAELSKVSGLFVFFFEVECFYMKIRNIRKHEK